MSGTEPKSPASPTARAEALARRHGLPSFYAWRTALEHRYTVMPPWYWNDRHCRENYISHVRAAIDWERRERRINHGNAAFQASLGR
jgi:hypothetical protein